MSKRHLHNITNDDPYQAILVLCHDCKHTSLQVLKEDGVYTCPCCGSRMKPVSI